MHNMIRKSIAGILCMVTCITASVDTYAAENIYSFSSVSLQTEGTSQYNAESRGDIESEAKETRNVNELESEESITNTMISVAEESNDTTEQELETHTEIKNETESKSDIKTDVETSAEPEAESNIETETNTKTETTTETETNSITETSDVINTE